VKQRRKGRLIGRWLRRAKAMSLRAFCHHRSITWCSWPQSLCSPGYNNHFSL